MSTPEVHELHTGDPGAHREHIAQDGPYVVYCAGHRVEGHRDNIAALLASVGAPVSPAELDAPELAYAMVSELAELGFLAIVERPSAPLN